MTKKIKVGIIFGGKSAEHEVSLQSARNIFQAIDRDRFEPSLFGIDKKGRWHLVDGKRFLAEPKNDDIIEQASLKPALAALPSASSQAASKEVESFASSEASSKVEVCFPILHGPYGEDGTIQGFLKLAGIPFVGAGVLGSAVGMDKDVMKRLLRDAGLPIPKFLTLTRREAAALKYSDLQSKLGAVLFIKPANLGSSVGISRATNQAELDAAVLEAFKFDQKILIEEGIEGREIECAVLGNDEPKASLIGEVIPASKHGFYSYDAKYIDAEGAKLQIPAKLDADTLKRAQKAAIDSFRALCCEGLARVDMFLKPNGEILVNEINTLPGFTNISMYPKLWEISGLAYKDLISKLLELALERAEREKRLQTTK